MALHRRGWVVALGLLGCGPKPGTEAPVAKAAATEPPVTETPAAVTETPVTETPAAVTETPVTETPVVAQQEAPAAAPPAAAGEVEPTMTVTKPRSATVEGSPWAPADPPNKLPKGGPGIAVWGNSVRQQHAGELAKYFTGWLLDQQKAGYKLVQEHHGREMSSASLVHPSGPRIMVKMTDSGSDLQSRVLAVTRPVAPPALSSPCVPVPEVEFQIVLTHALGTRKYAFATTFDIDLDGDGVFDARVPLATDARCPEDVREALYVTRGACGHRVGTVGPWMFTYHHTEQASPPASGFKGVLMSTGAEVDGKRIIGSREYTFVDGAYRETRAETKDVPCPHCKPPTCSGPQPIP